MKYDACYRVTITGNIEIEAESAEDAVAKLRSMPDDELFMYSYEQSSCLEDYDIMEVKNDKI